LKPINGKSKRDEKHQFLRPRPRNYSICELVRNWLISFGGKAQLNAKRTDQKGLEMTNRLKNERGKEKNTKNISRTQRVILLPNLGGHKEDSGPPFPLKSWFLHKSQGLVDLSLTST
jgi:hypothetical protein